MAVHAGHTSSAGGGQRDIGHGRPNYGRAVLLWARPRRCHSVADAMQLRPRSGGAAVVAGTVARSPGRREPAGGIIGVVRLRRAVVVAVATLGVLGPAPASAATASAHAGSACRVPRLRGLTLARARARARHAGCTLRVSGAARGDGGTRTIARQSPGARVRSAGVTVWLDPAAAKKSGAPQAGQAPVAAPQPPAPQPAPAQPAARTCAAEGLPVSGSRIRDPEVEGPFGDPQITPGPTELVSGFFLEGGPAAPEGCEWPAPTPDRGTVEVKDASGEVVATQTSEVGHLVEIALPPGTYTVTSTFVSATFCLGAGTANCSHPVETESVTLTAGYTFRRDLVVQIA